MTDLAAFLDGVKAGQVPQSLKSEPSPLGGGADPGSGRVEKVVGMNLLETVSSGFFPDGVDCVLAVHNGVDRKSYKKNLVTVAEKLAHVPTLTFGSFDVDKNELPAELSGECRGACIREQPCEMRQASCCPKRQCTL